MREKIYLSVYISFSCFICNDEISFSFELFHFCCTSRFSIVRGLVRLFSCALDKPNQLIAHILVFHVHHVFNTLFFNANLYYWLCSSKKKKNSIIG